MIIEIDQASQDLLKQKREAEGMTQEYLAQGLGTSVRAIRDAENGRATDVTLEILCQHFNLKFTMPTKGKLRRK